MSEHTPGPWHIQGRATIKAGEMIGVAAVKAYRRDANARLIAAAPDLLEALKECLSCEFAVTDKEAIAKAKAALAKATGEA